MTTDRPIQEDARIPCITIRTRRTLGGDGDESRGFAPQRLPDPRGAGAEAGVTP